MQLIKLKFLAQQRELKWLMLNKQRKLFHSSREKLTIWLACRRVWFLVSMYRIWIMGSKLILSSNQSRETLWVLDTCHIVGLLPLIIMLITVSLSSNTYNIAMDWEILTFESTLLNMKQFRTVVHVWSFRLILGALARRGVMQQVSLYPWILGFIGLILGALEHFYNQIPKSRAGISSIRRPASRESIPASVELCETEVCFLHIQLIGTNVWLPKMHKIPPDVDFESSESPAKSESWNNPNLLCCVVFPTWQYCLSSLVWWM